MTHDPVLQDGASSFSILFVCTGNTCRSPMAEALASAELQERGWAHVTARSAGVSAGVDYPANPHAREVAARHGLDLQAHRSRLLTDEIVARADLILVMSPAHLTRVVALGGSEKVELLDRFAFQDGRHGGIPDPFGGGLDDYKVTFHHLESLISRALDRLEPVLAP